MSFARPRSLVKDVTRIDSQRRFLAQHCVAILLRHCFEWLQHCSNIATMCCAKNRGCKSSRLTSPRHEENTRNYIILCMLELSLETVIIFGTGNTANNLRA